MTKGIFEDTYLPIDGENSQPTSSRRWVKVAVALVGTSCLALLSIIGTGGLTSSDAVEPASITNLADADASKEPVLFFALPFEITDLDNTTLGRAGVPEGGDEKNSAEACIKVLADELKHLQELSADEKVAGKLADRKFVDSSHQSTDLDRATLGKGDTGKGKGKKGSLRKPDDPLAGIKAGFEVFWPSAFSASVAESIAIPFDTAKVKMQLATSGEYSGMADCISKIAKADGVGGLWKGVVPGIQRQIVFGGLRIGLYDPVKGQIQKLMYGENMTGPAPLPLKVLAGMATGAIAMCVASPTELVKVRMQAGVAGKYPNAFAAYGIIAKEEGFFALWNGLAPNIIANSMINAAELAGYDQTKEILLGTGMKDSLPCHLASGFGAGLSAAIFGSPFDVVKSRVLDDSKGIYKGFFDCMGKTVSKEGPGAFYKGFGPQLGYRAGWNMVCFSTLEAVRQLIKKEESV